MAGLPDRKLYLGARLRRLRRELGTNQSRMAAEIGVSPSYLNHMERNQRPVTAQVLLRLANAYDIDLRAFAADGDGAGARDLGEAFADPLFADLGVPRHEITEVADAAPAVAEAIVRLYQAYVDQRRLPSMIEQAAAAAPGHAPSDWVRDHLQAQHGHFAELEEPAEALAAELAATDPDFVAAARARLAERHGVRVQLVAAEVLDDAVRHYDLHRRRLLLSELLGAPGRGFAIAYQLALATFRPAIDALVARAAPPDVTTTRLLRVALANYAAAALMMPYARFHAAAEATGYDLDRLCARFGASFEQAGQRLTTLGRVGQRGIPFFMLRVDPAGNVSKRFAGADFPFSRFGGTCPRWTIHAAFRTPGRIVTQIVETPDGERYFTLSRTVPRTTAAPGAEADLAIGLGCALKHAPRLAAARGLDLQQPLVTPIGPACHLCERPACPQRAAPPISRTLLVDETRKPIAPYPFAAG